LRLPVEPRHIECFDNSNIQGTIQAAVWYLKMENQVKKSIVILISKQSKVQMILHLRGWFIVVTNAFRRKEPLPNLIIIDGGKGQLSSALKV
jgi:excinuclease ABC subunit C